MKKNNNDDKFAFFVSIVFVILLVGMTFIVLFSLASKVSQLLGLDIDLGVMTFIVVCLIFGWWLFKAYIKWLELQPRIRNDLWAEFAGEFILPYANQNQKVTLHEIDPNNDKLKEDYRLGYDLSRLSDVECQRIAQMVRLDVLEKFCNNDVNFFSANYRVTLNARILIIVKRKP